MSRNRIPWLELVGAVVALVAIAVLCGCAGRSDGERKGWARTQTLEIVERQEVMHNADGSSALVPVTDRKTTVVTTENGETTTETTKSGPDWQQIEEAAARAAKVAAAIPLASSGLGAFGLGGGALGTAAGGALLYAGREMLARRDANKQRDRHESVRQEQEERHARVVAELKADRDRYAAEALALAKKLPPGVA